MSLQLLFFSVFYGFATNLIQNIHDSKFFISQSTKNVSMFLQRCVPELAMR